MLRQRFSQVKQYDLACPNVGFADEDAWLGSLVLKVRIVDLVACHSPPGVLAIRCDRIRPAAALFTCDNVKRRINLPGRTKRVKDMHVYSCV